MTTVPPPINPALPQLLAAAVNAPTATIVAPPAVLAALTAGTTLQGTVTPTADPRVMMLTTAAGEVSLRTPTPLPDGATVNLEIVRASTAQISVRLVAIDGAPVQLQPTPRPPVPIGAAPPLPIPAPLPSVPGTPVALQPGTAWWPGGPQPITALPVLSGFVIAAPAPQTPPTQIAPTSTPTAPVPATTPAPAPVLVTGAEVALRIVAVTLPSANAAPTSTPTTPAPMQAAAPPVPLAPAQTSAPPPVVPTPAPIPVATIPLAPAPAITITDLTPAATRVADPQTAPGLVLPKTWPAPEAAPPATVQPQPPLARVTGVVIALNDGVPVVRIGEAEVQINARANLPVGSTVTVEVRAVQPPLTPASPATAATPAVVAPQPPPALAPLSLAQPSWPTLTESLTLLQRADPVAAQQLANAIADGGPRTAVAVMSFVQAMRSGEARQWPGDATLRALERAGPRGAHLAAQLGAEIESLSRAVRDAGTEWRALPLPWQADGQVERVRMVMREVDPDAEAEKRKTGGGTRFLVDLDLSRLGALQLDGMFRKASRQLDVTIRTKAALAEAIRRDLTGLFAQSNAAMGLAGGLTFQVVPRFPDPLARTAPGDKSGLWV